MSPKNRKYPSQLRRRAAREDGRPAMRDGSIPAHCGTSPTGWPVHVYRLNARVGDRCFCGSHRLEVGCR